MTRAANRYRVAKVGDWWRIFPAGGPVFEKQYETRPLARAAARLMEGSTGRAELRVFLASDPSLGGVNVDQLAQRLYARGLRAPKVNR